METLAKALQSSWEGYEELRAKAQECPMTTLPLKTQTILSGNPFVQGHLRLSVPLCVHGDFQLYSHGSGTGGHTGRLKTRRAIQRGRVPLHGNRQIHALGGHTLHRQGESEDSLRWHAAEPAAEFRAGGHQAGAGNLGGHDPSPVLSRCVSCTVQLHLLRHDAKSAGATVS